MSCPTQFLQGLFIDDYDFPTDTYLFQDDNAPVHASRETERWKQENNIKRVTWPYQSSDHNIIENMWHTIKIRLQSQITDVKNRTQHVAKMKEMWTSLPQHYVRSEYASIPKRLCRVIRSYDYATKY